MTAKDIPFVKSTLCMANLHINLLIKAKTPKKIYNIRLFLNKKNKLNKSYDQKMCKDINRMPIIHAPYATTKRYIILACVRQLHLSSTVYYRIFAWHTIEQLDPPILLDK